MTESFESNQEKLLTKGLKKPPAQLDVNISPER